MIVDPVTARWTEALFNLAQRRGATEAVHQDVERLALEVDMPKVRAWLTLGGDSAQDRKLRLAPLLETFHELTANFVRLVVDRGRQEVLIGLPEAFRVRLLREQGAVEGVVEAAHPMDSGDTELLAQALGQRLGKRVLLEARVNPELIGGVRVTVGSRMIDYSVQGRLETLRRRLLEAPLPGAA